MNARVQQLRKASHVAPPFRNPSPTNATRLPKVPVQLSQIPWGRRDKETAFAVIQNMVDTTPGTHVRWSLRDSKLRHLLRTCHFVTE